MTDRPTGVTLGFLTVLNEASGYTGGYLVANGWGRPLEFRLSTPIRPNRVQQILYGSTLDEYLHVDLIGRTLIEKTGIVPDLIVTDTLACLPLQTIIHRPVVALGQSPNHRQIEHPRSSTPLLIRDDANHDAILAILNEIDSAVDLAEPFGRIRDAVLETRTSGQARAA